MKSKFLFYFFPSILRMTLSIFAIVPLTTYYLDPKDFGMVAIIGALTSLAAPLCSPGVVWVLSAHFFKTEGEERKSLLFNVLMLDFVLKGILAIVFSVLGPRVLPLIIKDYYQNPDYLYYFKLSLCGILLAGVWPSLSFILILMKRASFHAFLECLQLVVGIAATVLCLTVFHVKTSTLLISPIAASAAGILVCLWYLRSHLTIKPSKKWCREIFEIGRYSVAWNFLETFSDSVDRVFIERWSNLRQLGIYAHALSYRQMFSTANKAFTNTFVPDILESLKNKQDHTSMQKAFRQWFGLLSLGGVFVGLFSYDVIRILTHGKFVAAAPLVPVFYLLLFTHAHGTVYSQYLLMLKENAFLLYSNIAVTLLDFGISALLIWKYNIMGAAIATAVGHVLIQLVSRKFYALKRGCVRLEEGDMYWALGILGFAVFLNTTLELTLISRITISLLLSLGIVYRFRLHESLRDLGRRFTAGGKMAGASV